jgi:hypothetical protein
VGPLILAELAVAEQGAGDPWHPGHIRPFKQDVWPQLVFPASVVLAVAASFAGGWAGRWPA